MTFLVKYITCFFGFFLRINLFDRLLEQLFVLGKELKQNDEIKTCFLIAYNKNFNSNYKKNCI